MGSCLSKGLKGCVVGFVALALLAGCGKIDSAKLIGAWKLERFENLRGVNFTALKFQDNRMSAATRASREFSCGVEYTVDGNKLRWKEGCGIAGQEVEIEDLNDSSLAIKYAGGKVFYKKMSEAEALR